jgi:DNA-binding NtrC family response regulator
MRVLAIDQDRASLEQLASVCREHGAAFVGSQDLCEGLRWLNLSPVDMIFCDVAFLRDGLGNRFTMRDEERAPLLVATVGENSLETEASIRQLDPYYYLLKPFDHDEIGTLLASAERALT